MSDDQEKVNPDKTPLDLLDMLRKVATGEADGLGPDVAKALVAKHAPGVTGHWAYIPAKFHDALRAACKELGITAGDPSAYPPKDKRPVVKVRAGHLPEALAEVQTILRKDRHRQGAQDIVFEREGNLVHLSRNLVSNQAQEARGKSFGHCASNK